MRSGVEWLMLAGCAGAVFPIVMLLRRRRASLAGRRLEPHTSWQSAPWQYWPLWLFAVVGAIGVVDDGVRVVEVAAWLLFVALWAYVGVLLYRQRRLERTH